MKYILIQNDGEIESNSFELIGASTKRGEKNKIGFFGSGLKYSIAYMMRNNISFRIFSGLHELSFSLKKESLKDKSFDRICINEVQTSYTTTMGPTWTEDWFVLREIYCNAIDEEKCVLVKETENVSPTEGKTRIYIELTDNLKTIINEWDCYFSDEREKLFEAEKIYTSSVGNNDGDETRYQGIKVYKKTRGIIYRKGIKVFEKKFLLFDYELNHININEDRTAKDIFYLNYSFSDLAGQMANEEWVKQVLKSGENDRVSNEYEALSGERIDQPVSEKWVNFSQENMLVVKELSGRYAEEISISRKDVYYLPIYFAKQLKEQLPNIDIAGMGALLGGGFLTIFNKSPKMEFLLKEVLHALKEMKYEINYEIKIAEFESDSVLGRADIKNETIFLSRRVFDMGRREIALTLMEENEHIISNQDDFTRAFQNHIFSGWLKTMEESNSLFL